MVTTFTKLVEMMQQGTIPDWIRDAVIAQREEISKSLHDTGAYTLNGPNGEQVDIRANNSAVAA